MTETNDSRKLSPRRGSMTTAESTDVAPNPLFRLVIIATVAFLLTILLLLATTLSSTSSSIRQFLDLYGMTLIGIELTVILTSGFLAMALDRRQTLARKFEREVESTTADVSKMNENKSPPG